jgi:hypothetical protein
MLVCSLRESLKVGLKFDIVALPSATPNGSRAHPCPSATLIAKDVDPCAHIIGVNSKVSKSLDVVSQAGSSAITHTPNLLLALAAVAYAASDILIRSAVYFTMLIFMANPATTHMHIIRRRSARCMRRTALAAAGYPDCRLKEVLELCDTCTGSCGVEFFPSGFCGEDVVQSVVTELVKKVAHTSL